MPGAGPGRKITIDTSSPRRALVVALAGLAVLAGCSTARTAGEASVGSAPAVDTRAFQPSKTNKDPSKDIKGVVMTRYKPGHARPGQRVAYDTFPPYGGQHDPYWADCSGTVYTKTVRNENMVHAMEHGAVWIAYNPKKVSGLNVRSLAAKVDEIGRAHV